MNHVVLGASAAGIKAAGMLRELDPTSGITIVSKDKQIYSRCMLHLKLAGRRDCSRLSFVARDYLAAGGIQWLSGETADNIDIDANAVLLKSGKRVQYDKLLIASGASAFIPPIPNLRGANNVASLREMRDVHILAALASPGSKAVIIGAGLVGMDAAIALLELGASVTLVEMADRVLAIQLDDYAASRYEALLKRHGIEVIVGAKVEAAIPDGEGGIRALELAGGRTLPCDVCVVAAGVAPNIDFVRDERIKRTENGRAIAVDRHCRTSVDTIFAAGDVTFLAPIWPEAVRQAEVAAKNMAGGDAALPDQDWAWTNSMNFFGLPTVSYGRTAMADPSYIQETYVDGDIYKKVVHKDGLLHGAIFQGDVDNCGVYLRLIRDKVPVGGIGKPLLKLNYADFFQQRANGEFV